ncbi:MAG TPA: radical SAM protein [Candidatus Eisenbacteria bacterium]|nr:radical SAM protein [Candidatus Eisenbacteria bacterium]
MAGSLDEFLQSVTTRWLHLIVLPTEACNLRCVYCYESFELKRMQPAVVMGVKALLERRVPTLDRLTVSWFGGEPLLARDIVEDVMSSVRESRRAHPDLTVTSDMTTNGLFLSPTALERLADLGVSEFQISLDGPKHLHDRKRVHPGGAPTFDRIWGNLVAAREARTPFEIQVRLHVDAENAAAIPEFLDDFRAAFDADPRFRLFIRGLSRLGGARDGELRILEGDDRRRIIGDLKAQAAARGIPLARVPDEPGVCYAARGNSFVIRADGRVNKCTVALSHPANQVGVLLEDGSLRLRSEMVRPWMRGFASGSMEELACPMKGLAIVEQRSVSSAVAVPVRLPVNVEGRPQ